ncbi:MAG: S8 family serine peptidase [Bacteroidota bacterium]|nr:S8 family serine peptidase [Bacteroidota bacterium]
MKNKITNSVKQFTVCILFIFTFYACNKEKTLTNNPILVSENIVGFSPSIPVPNHYIIVLKDDIKELEISKRSNNPELFKAAVTNLSNTIIDSYDNLANIEHVYSNSLVGFSVEIEDNKIELLKKDPRVLYVEQDQIISLDFESLNKGKSKPTTETPSQTIPYGITRVKGKNYTGENVLFIFDTGLDLLHPDLNIDVTLGYNATSGRDAKSLNDDNGHGTHVAGTAAAINNSIGVVGVAAGAKVVPIKVLGANGSGTISGIIAGINHVANTFKNGDVANMSLGGGVSQALDDAVKNAANKGLKFALAAGNSGADANNSSPARVNHSNVYTISAMNNLDVFASWSNYGNPPIDYCQPGVNIYSTYIGGSYNTLSGTSMAAPHFAGILLHNSWINDGNVSNDKDLSPDVIAIVN